MKIRLLKGLLYSSFVLLIIWGQFLSDKGLLSGKLPIIKKQTINGMNATEIVSKGPAIIYFWAEWCGLCKMMQAPVSAVLNDYPGITVAIKSGNDLTLNQYMKAKSLNWKVINDTSGELGEQFKVTGVPAVFFLNQQGDIALNTVGYTSEIGLRLRLWLVSMGFKLF